MPDYRDEEVVECLEAAIEALMEDPTLIVDGSQAGHYAMLDTALRELHKEDRAPEGHVFMGKKPGQSQCLECSAGGDPYLAQDYPCTTIKLLDAVKELINP